MISFQGKNLGDKVLRPNVLPSSLHGPLAGVDICPRGPRKSTADRYSCVDGINVWFLETMAGNF